ncbi:proteasome B-type subunit [Kipferlia bialata]|uniref:Proteasome subunit beta n=1 Tax=Kipferlia bialata TaxID=797122 RepID=A0A9K3CQY2_9EUKA|nr:proteasome B-type subunit [Kipferlia bialata]|eukprot:g1706.t1
MSFSPYTDNGGTCVAIAGPDYVLIAGDTRMSDGYNILHRDIPKLSQFNENIVMGTAGMHADMIGLRKELGIRQQEYEYQARTKMGVAAFAQLLATTLYNRRFFPFYTFNILAGVDTKDNTCAIYTYDAVGCVLKAPYAASGAGESLVLPVLDAELKARDPVTAEEAKRVLTAAFRAADEREISTGDTLMIWTMRPGQEIVKETMPLRRD